MNGLPSIAMCWDGQTEKAELIIDGWGTEGAPYDVEAAFDVLKNLRDEVAVARRMLAEINLLVHKLSQCMP